MGDVNRPFPDNDDKVTVNEIIARIRQELARRQNRNENSHKEFYSDSSISFPFTENLASSQDKLPLLSLYPTCAPQRNGKYPVNDLLSCHQEEFVKSAFITVLGREADPVGLNIFLNRLDSGMSKIEILGRMRYSPEGRKKGIKVRGLLAPLTVQMLYKIPVFGYLCRLGISLLRLPKALRDRINFEHSSLYQNKIFQAQLNQNFQAINNEFNKLGGAILESGHNFSMLMSKLDGMTEKFNEGLGNLTEHVNQAMSQRDDRISRIEEITKNSLNERDDRIKGIEELMSNSLKEHHDRINRLKKSVIARDDQSDNRIKELGESVNQWEDALELIESKKAEREELLQLAEQKAGKGETRQIQEEVKEISKQIHDHKLHILDQQRRLKLLLEEARKRLPKPITRKQIKEMAKEEDHLLDAMYVSFEDKFRGTREHIKVQMKEYLPYIRDCKAGTADAPILDIGCGRGEWLELCKETELHASGVDLNGAMIARCKELALEVTQTDAVRFLETQDSDKFGAITGFHVIEHIDYAKRIAFLDEALRTLKPGGIAIFETPNPENLIVGAFSFYLDPTHINPLVPETMKFILEQRGFVDITIKRLHKNKAYYHKKTDNEFKNKWFFSEMDYAVIGYKK